MSGADAYSCETEDDAEQSDTKWPVKCQTVKDPSSLQAPIASLSSIALNLPVTEETKAATGED